MNSEEVEVDEAVVEVSKGEEFTLGEEVVLTWLESDASLLVNSTNSVVVEVEVALA